MKMPQLNYMGILVKLFGIFLVYVAILNASDYVQLHLNPYRTEAEVI